MKRRTFIKKSSIGLGAMIAGAGGADRLLKSERDKRRIYGIPDSVRTRTQEELDLTRYSLARADLPPQVWEQILGLTLLAQDVFDRPEVAQAFGRNPQGYLQRAGLQGVVLDPQALEVRIALAVGDPEIHDAVARDDPDAFLRASERKRPLQSPEP